MSKCYADVRNVCVALKVKSCKDCKFFKTQKEYDDGIKKTRKRLIKKGVNFHMKVIQNKIIDEAVKIKKDYPHPNHYEALEMAKKIYKEKEPTAPQQIGS